MHTLPSTRDPSNLWPVPLSPAPAVGMTGTAQRFCRAVLPLCHVGRLPRAMRTLPSTRDPSNLWPVPSRAAPAVGMTGTPLTPAIESGSCCRDNRDGTAVLPLCHVGRLPRAWPGNKPALRQDRFFCLRFRSCLTRQELEIPAHRSISYQIPPCPHAGGRLRCSW